MIDFNTGRKVINVYTGSELKQTVIFDGRQYMLKFPDPVEDKKIKNVRNLSYKNNQYSEHIGSTIFAICGFNAQKTVLGYCSDGAGKQKVVVACEDFTQDGSKLHQFSTLRNEVIGDHPKLGESIEDVYQIVNSISYLENKQEILDGFWDMFVIDALIGNRDRHLGNWGVLEKAGKIKPAPVYDCGSSLGAMLSDQVMEELLNSDTGFRNIEYNVNSCYTLGGKKIPYREIFKTPPHDLQEAIMRIVPKIDIAKICTLIDETPQMLEIRREYLKKAVMLRYKEILAPALKRVLKQSRTDGSREENLPQKLSLQEVLADAKRKADAHNLNREMSNPTKSRTLPER